MTLQENIERAYKALQQAVNNRGGIAEDEIGYAFAALLFLRWLDFMDGEYEAMAAFEEQSYTPVLPSRLHWRSWYDLAADGLEPIFQEIMNLDDRNAANLSNPLSAALTRCMPAIRSTLRDKPIFLKPVIDWIADMPFETFEDRRQILACYDEVIDRYWESTFGMQNWRTPRALASLAASIAQPSSNDRIYDPCFCAGEFLVAALDVVQRGRDKGKQLPCSDSPTVFGVEPDDWSYIIGFVRLVLTGVTDPHLEIGLALEKGTPGRTYDIVLMNPVWGGRPIMRGTEHYPIQSNSSEGFFIQHALMHLRPGGRCVAIIPDGLLFRSGGDQQLRAHLAKEHTIEAVVRLPEDLFRPETSIRSNILVFRRGGPTTVIRMLDATSFFSVRKGRKIPHISEEEIQTLCEELAASQPGPNSWNLDVAEMEGLDWDLSPKRRKVSTLHSTLGRFESQTRIVALAECCDVQIGRSVRTEHLQEEVPNELPIAFLRIRDIQRGQVNRPTSWLTPDAAASIDPAWRVRAGDVVLSKSGTIGKAGIVRNGAVGGIPTTGLLVLRANQEILDPHYLVAYLESGECRSWFNDRSRGTTIRHLSRKVVATLPIPLPALQIQQRVATECREHGLDALNFLAQLLAESDGAPIAAWVGKVVQGLPEALSNPLDLSVIEQLAVNVREVRNRVAHGNATEPVLGRWLLSFHDAMLPLAGVTTVPAGPGLLALLQEATRGIERARSFLAENLAEGLMAQSLNEFVTSALKRAVSALTSDVRLLFEVDSQRLSAGEMACCELAVQNEGALPLRQVVLRTIPDWGGKQIDYFAERQTLAMSLNGPTPKTPGMFTIEVLWSAVTLDGSAISATREIAFEIVEPSEAISHRSALTEGSPYVCGDPIRPERKDIFFGREELIDQIHRQIVESGNVVLLEGNRRAGKSSILRHLEGTQSVPGWLGVYCSLQGAEGSTTGVGVPTAEVFREIANCIAKGIHSLGDDTPLPNGSLLHSGQKFGIRKACREAIGEAAPFSDFRDYVEAALDHLEAKGLGILLMLDEFDKLQEGIDHGVTSPQVPENIRFMVQTYPKFSAILTGSRRLKRLREEYWSALFGLGTRFGVSALSEEAALRLVTEPVKGRLVYSKEAAQHAIYLTARQPYLLQCLCNRIYDFASTLKARSITLDHVDQAADALVEDNEHFASLWDYVRVDRRRLILALSHQNSTTRDFFKLGVIQEQLAAQGVEVDDETLIADLEALRELELLELTEGRSGDSYTPSIPLMGAWIERQQDLAVLQRRARIETEDEHA